MVKVALANSKLSDCWVKIACPPPEQEKVKLKFLSVGLFASSIPSQFTPKSNEKVITSLG